MDWYGGRWSEPFQPKTKTFSFFTPSSAFTNVHGLCLIGDHLWVGTFSKGVKVVDTRTGAIVKTYQKTDSPRSLIDNSVFSICCTTTGDIYLGTYSACSDIINSLMISTGYRN